MFDDVLNEEGSKWYCIEFLFETIWFAIPTSNKAYIENGSLVIT